MWPALVLLLLPFPPVRAEWEVATEPLPGSRGPVKTAYVENPSGHSLRIYIDQRDRVHGMLSLAPGFDVMAPGSCPSYRVDAYAPVAVRFDGEPCRLEARRALFSLGRLDEGRVRSPPLVRLMNGARVLFRYPLDGVGYRETEFTLAGSREALTEAVGEDTPIVDSR